MQEYRENMTKNRDMVQQMTGTEKVIIKSQTLRNIIYSRKKDRENSKWPPEDFISKSSKYIISADKNEVIKNMKPVLHSKIHLPIPLRLSSKGSKINESLRTKQSNQTQRVIFTQPDELNSPDAAVKILSKFSCSHHENFFMKPKEDDL